MSTAVSEIATDKLGFFRWGRVAGRILITTDAGEWTFATDAELDELLTGKIGEGHDRFDEWRGKGLLRDHLDVDALATTLAGRLGHVVQGPRLFVVTLTTRCPQSCRHCGARRRGTDVDMDRQTSEQIVNLALQTRSPNVDFVFQADGGEPLLNFDVLRHFVDFARARNQEAEGKSLGFALVSNLSAATEESAAWLVANGVRVATTLDGPAALHDGNRTWKHGTSHETVVRWIDYFTQQLCKSGTPPPADGFVDALLTVTRRTLGAFEEVIDEYARRTLKTIRLRPLHPAFHRAEWGEIGYTTDEYLAFQRRALDSLLARSGGGVRDHLSATFAARILSSNPPRVVDLQSPNGAGTSQIACDADGTLYPSDEARRIAALGDPLFAIGRADRSNIQDLLRHPTVRAIAGASLLDCQAMCSDCWNKPYCGIDPIFSYATQGDLLGQRPRSAECKEHMSVAGRIFELLRENDPATVESLRRWATQPEVTAIESRASIDPP